MPTLLQLGLKAWRRFVVDHDPSSGNHHPEKEEIADFVGAVNDAVGGVADAAASALVSAEAATEAAVAAEEAAVTAAGVGGIGGAVVLATPVAGDRSQVVLASGHRVYVDTTRNNLAPPLQESTAVFVKRSGRGTRIEKEATLVAVDSSHNYAGPAYDGALWLARPRLRADGNIDAFVCWDRGGRDWDRIVIDSNGAVLTAAFGAGVMLAFPSYGQSLSQGGTPLADAAAYTSSAVDAGNALMFDIAAFANPYTPGSYAVNGLTDLRHVLVSSYGETHLGAFALRMLAAMNTAGAKIPGVYWTSGMGGHSLRDLSEDAEPYYPYAGKSGGGWESFVRRLNSARQEIADGFGGKAAAMPLTFIHGEEDSGFPGLMAVDYRAGLVRLANAFNADLRHVFNWAGWAPDLPVILTQCRRTPPWMYTSGNARIFKRGVDSPMLAQWAAPFFDRRLVLAGANYHLPCASDGAHLTPAGYFRLGEQIARQFWACTFGTGPRRFNPVAVIRQSGTVFDIVFKTPGGALAFDTTQVTDALDGFKGFVCWDNTANAAVAIASVAIQAADTVRITLLGTPASTVELWCDYALWGDSASLTSQTTTGPRGNLRTDTGYASLISSYGGSAVTDYDWCPAFRIPVPRTTGAATWLVDGRL